MTAPVLLVFYSRSQAPESATLADDLATLSGEFEGGSSPAWSTSTPRRPIAQAMQIPSVPLLVVLLDGRPVPLLPGRAAARGAARRADPGGPAAHRPGHHRPAPAAHRPAPPVDAGDDDERARRRPALRRRPGRARRGRHRRRGRGVPEAGRRQPGRRRGRCRAGDGQGAPAHPGRRPADRPRGRSGRSPDDVDAQTLVADLDLLGGHVDDAFTRLVDAGPAYVRRRARRGPRAPARRSSRPSATTTRACSRGRQNLASALF